MVDYHLKYNELINKTNALFAEDSKILGRIFNMINYSPMQVIEQKEEREEIVRETEKKFSVICRFFRDFIERNYVSRVKPFRSYTGILEAYDLIDRFMGDNLGAITMEAIIMISLPGEKTPLRNLIRMLIHDIPVNENTSLKKCMVCKVTGANMRRCKKCGQVYCVECALKGRPPYPKIPARNICPMCGAYDKSETAR